MRAKIQMMISIISLIHFIKNKCFEGCLKCKIGSNTCLVCDTPAGYILNSGGTCGKRSIPNCSVLAVDGLCFECQTKYYPIGGLCAEVSVHIDNCAVMFSATECKNCATGYYYSNKLCRKIENPIDNCLYYEEEGVCGRCVSQAFLFIDQRYCYPMADPGDCLSWTQIQCSKCKQGYFLNYNLYFTELFKNITNVNQTQSFLSAQNNKLMRFQTNVCQKGNIINCEIFNGPDECVSCSTGFTLLAGQCYNITSPQIRDCNKVDALGACIECSPGFYVQQGSCIPIIPIYQCQRYNYSSSIVECLECTDEYYLSQNKCFKRSLSLGITNCTDYNPFDDSCQNCANGTALTDDKLFCLPEIDNCKTYFPSSRSSAALQCKYCNDMMYFNAKLGACTNGTVENCLVYEQFSDECSICENGFYKSNLGTCLPHMYHGVRTCETWSQSVPHSCDICPANYIHLPNKNSCNALKSTISNCEIYKTITTCNKCASGFVPSNDKKSCVSASVPRCMQESAPSTCEQCDKFTDSASSLTAPYVLSAAKNTCDVPDLTLFNNCKRLTASGQSQSCAGCKQLYYPNSLNYRFGRCLNSSNYKLTKPTVIPKLTDCEIFDLDASQCIKCKNSKLVQNGACVTACSAGKIIFMQEILKDYVNNIFYVYRRNYCDTPPFANCAKVATSVNTRGLNYVGAIVQGCVECLPGFFPLIDLAYSDSGLAHFYSSNPDKRTPSNRFIFVHDCVATATALSNKLTGSTSFANCRYIQQISSLYGCLSCNFGYTGVVITASNGYFIESCTTMSTCDASKWFSGFGGLPGQLKTSGAQKFPLELYASCHQCVDPNKVVVFETNTGHTRSYTSTALTGGLSIWGIDANPAYSTATPIAQTVCMTPPTAWNMPQYCAMVLVVADLPLSGYISDGHGSVMPISNTGIFCVACQPGYKATANSNGYVTSCDKIYNCVVTEFNGCGQCDDDYAFGFRQDLQSMDFGYCLSNAKSPNCLFGYVNMYKIFVCMICQGGFTLNHDFLCDPVEVEDCALASIFSIYSATAPTSIARAPLDMLIWFEPNSCKQCANGQIVIEGTNQLFCLKNSFMSTYGVPSSGYFARNCVDSYYDNETTTIRCSECSDDTINISGRCYPKADPNKVTGLGNCTVFDRYTQKCAHCDDFNFLDAGICYEGLLPSCAEYETWEKCKRCAEGYILIPTKSGAQICLAPSSGLNCKQFNSTSSLHGELECSQCDDNYYLATSLDETPPYTCLEVSAVKNCAIHNTTFNIMFSAFECLSCKPNFFLKYNYCFKRTNVTDCAQYDLYENKCVMCAETHVLDSSGLKCELISSILMPIANCRRLFDLETCEACVENYYLAENTCVEVPKEKLLRYCLYYTAQLTCENCVPGFVSLKNECVLANAKDCLEYESINRCLSCPQGYGFELSDNLLNCVKVDLSNCGVYDTEKPKPFECKTCTTNYYLDNLNKTCVQVGALIEFCIIYKDASTCSKCQTDMVISPDGKYCYASPDILDFVDENCEERFLSNNPLCNACAYGNYFNDKQCTPCKNNMLMSGCMYCDPADEDNCLMCVSGFYMNNAGICVRVILPSNSTSASILTIMIAVFLQTVLLLL